MPLIRYLLSKESLYRQFNKLDTKLKFYCLVLVCGFEDINNKNFDRASINFFTEIQLQRKENSSSLLKMMLKTEKKKYAEKY